MRQKPRLSKFLWCNSHKRSRVMNRGHIPDFMEFTLLDYKLFTMILNLELSEVATYAQWGQFIKVGVICKVMRRFYSK